MAKAAKMKARAKVRTLKVVADKTGFTEAYLSQVETGRVQPSLAALKRIAAGYGISLVDLFDEPRARGEEIVLPLAQRKRLVFGDGGVVKELLVRRQAGKQMEPLLVSIRPG